MNSDEKSLFFSEKKILLIHSTGTGACTVPHIHSYYEIYYNISGAKGFLANGEFYKCSERDLIIIPALSAHKVIVKKDCVYERCVINIDESIFDADIKNSFGISDGKIPGRVNLTGEAHEEFMHLIDEYNLTADKKAKEKIFDSVMQFLRRAFESTNAAEIMEDSSVSYTDRIIRIIEKDFQTLSVSAIASRAYVSRDHLNRVFKEDTGTTVSRYLIMRKLAEAQKQLRLGKSVKEACFLSGFNDYSNFWRTFKKYKGYPPGEKPE